MPTPDDYVTIAFWTAPDETACHCVGIESDECKFSRNDHPGKNCPGWRMPPYSKVQRKYLLKESLDADTN